MNKLRKYRFLSMLLVIALVFGMLPEHVQAARETGPYDRYQNGREPGGNLVDSWDDWGLNFELYDNGHAYYWSFYVDYDEPGCDYDCVPDDTMIVRKNTKEYLDSIREVTIGDYDDTGHGIYLTNPDWNHYDEVRKDGVFCVTGFDEAPLLEKATLYISADGIKDYNQYGSIYGSYEYLPANAFAYCPKLKKVYLVPANYHKGDLTFLNQSVVGPSKPAINSKAFMGDTLDIVVPMLCGLTMEDPVVKQEYQNADVTWIYDMDYDNNNNLLAANGGNLQVRFQMDGTLIISGNGDMVDFPEMEDMPWNAAKDKVREVIIQNGVTGIGKNAFKMCTNLEKVTLADSVTKIGDSAFEGCVSLKEIEWSKSLQSIGKRAFHSIAVRDIALPEGIVSIGEQAFYNSDAMRTFVVPSTVKSIGSQALAFNGGRAVISIYAKNPAVEEAIVSSWKERPITVKYPAESWSESLKEAVAGEYYDNVTWLALPQEGKLTDSLTWIYEEGKVTIKGYGAIPDYVRTSPAPWYSIRNQVHYVELPEELTAIGDAAFIGCDLYAVDIPANVTRIGANAFARNMNLMDITFLGRPTTIQNCFDGVEFAFVYYNNEMGWDSTNMLNYGAQEFRWDAVGGKCGDNLTWNLRTVDENVLTISGFGDMYDYEGDAPWNSHPIHKLVLSDSITYIGKRTFQNQPIESVTLPSNLQSIGDSAFSGCGELTTVDFNTRLQTIGANAFNNCKKLSKVFLPDTVAAIGSRAFGTCSSMTTLHLPYALQTIETYAFYKCEALEVVSIPANITSIGMSAFQGCTNLKMVALQDGNLETIGRNAFTSCTALAEMRIPKSVTTIGQYAFSHTVNLKELYLETSLQCIENSAFSDCGVEKIYYNGSVEQWNDISISANSDGNAALESATLVTYMGRNGENITWVYNPETFELRFSGTGPIVSGYKPKPAWSNLGGLVKSVILDKGITATGDAAFDMFDGLESVSLPDGLETIGKSAFHHCQNLSKVEIPTSVATIESGAFNATALSSVVLPEKITEIADWAFANNSKLKSISIPVSVKSIGNSAFEGSINIHDIYYTGSKQQWNEIIEKESGTSLHAGVSEGRINLHCVSLNAGSCGDAVNWSLTDQYDYDGDGNKDRCLLISGKGAMSDFAEAGPWLDEDGQTIKFIQIGEGVTTIGENAFKNMGSLTAVALPKSLTKVGKDAFAGCTVKDAAFAGTVHEYTVVDFTTGNEALKGANTIFNWSTSADTYKVRFDMQGHGPQVASQNVAWGYGASEPAVPVADGYVFAGWYTDAGCTAKYTFGSIVTANITLFAKWEKQMASPVISAVSSNASGVQVTWGAVSGAEQYRVFYKAATGTWQTFANVKGTSTTVTGLTSGTTYSFLVRCLSADGKTYTSDYDATKSKSITYIAQPAVSSVANAANGVEVKWNKVPGAAQYRVFYKEAGGAWTGYDNTKETSLVVSGLVKGKTYSFTVRCLSADGKTYTSTYDTTGKSIVYQPESYIMLDSPEISSLSSNASGVLVKWNAVKGAGQYRVFYKTATGAWTAFSNVNGTSVTVTGLTSGTTYTFLVRCLSSDGKTYTSEYDATKSKSHTYIAQPAVSSVSNTANGVEVKWNAIGGVAQYRVFYKEGTGTWTGFKNTTGTSMVVTGLTAGKTYSFTVRCVSADGKTYTSTYDTTGKSIVYQPAAGTMLANPEITALSSNASGVLVTWGAVSGASQYRVFYKPNGGSWTTFANVKGTSATVTGLTSGTTYSFLVRCLSADGKTYESEYDASKSKSLTYIAQPAVSSVTNTAGGVEVKWNAVGGAAQYRVFYKPAGGTWTGYKNTTGTSMTVTGLTKGTTYSFTVRCVSADGKSYTSTYDTTGKSIKYE